MLKNYFKTAYRNLVRNKVYAVINTTGLAVGIAACLLIFLVIQYETSFDNFHANANRIYRVSTEFHRSSGGGYSRGICYPAGKQLALDFPQLEHIASIRGARGAQLTVLDESGRLTPKKFKEDGLFYIEPQFFDIFNFPFITGDKTTALSAPGTAVMTQQAADKYFGDWHKAIGRSLQYDDNKICKITGILKDVPNNTDFPIQVAISFKSLDDDTSRDWISVSSNMNTFVVLPPGMQASSFSRSLIAFGQKHIPGDYAKKQSFVLQPLAEMHFDKRFGNYNGNTFGKDLITALSLIGIFLLVIACINFINLATAQAVNRAKEVGVRKVLGSGKPQLIAQFLCESFIITLAAVAIAAVIAISVLPLLNQLLETKIGLHINIAIALFLAGIIILVTLLSGLYPAIVLSGFNPITALKSRLTGRTKSGISLRRALVVLQFTVAQALIIGTLVVLSQMNYFRTAEMGFAKDAVVNIPLPGDSLSVSKFDVLKSQLLQQPGVTNVSMSTFSITDNSHWGSDFKYNGAEKETNFNADLKWADTDVFKTFDLQMVAGRPYGPSDTVKEFVVNETLVKLLGLKNPGDIIGKNLSFWDGQLKGPVVGVVKDFNGGSLVKAIAPVVMSTWKGVYGNLSVKIQPQRIKPTLAAVEKLWTAAFPKYIYEYQFLDDKIASFYKQEDQLSQLYTIFACIAIFISCLGLYGLVSFMAAQRIKEIGIRKVLGASAIHIVYLFSKEFTILITVAFLIASPLAYYFMHSWLQNYSYRVPLGAGIFAATIMASILIAWLTAGYRALRAALANPVKSLRTE
ncbi:MAG TPA: FtsX-like permease family protein [Chitinophagaceae bacterium]|nr:FtsX-like permease family protein [Chitinophagaceae bacterium]